MKPSISVKVNGENSKNEEKELKVDVPWKNLIYRLFLRSNDIWRWQWCWWHRYIGDLMMVTILRCWWQKSMLVTFFCMLVTSQSVTNIIICQNVMMVTDMLCWRHEIQLGSIFNTIFLVSVNKSRGTYIGHQHHYTPTSTFLCRILSCSRAIYFLKSYLI